MGGKFNMFVCGPTVYDYSHIGHARTYIAFDVIARWLRQSGVEVFYLQNITNIDDKIIARAHELKKDPLALAAEFENAYYHDMNALGIKSITHYARATDHIAVITAQVQALIEKGCAYKIEGDGYYFDLASFSDYGKLSGRTVTQAEDAITRIDESVGKRNKGDFCLWKFFKPGEPSWDSPLGAGRPGWHIEDTAISEKYFGPQYDIHGGGIDLKFPHHEAEIAQQESASGKKPFVRYWLHTGFLLIGGKKMSKSLGNFITIRHLLGGNEPAAIRYMVLSAHYRSPLDYSEELMTSARAALGSIREFIAQMRFVADKSSCENSPKNIPHLIQSLRLAFSDAMNDDFNTPGALASLHACMHEIEHDTFQLHAADAAAIADEYIALLNTLGISVQSPKIPDDIRIRAAAREEFRTKKEWSQADKARNDIEKAGYYIEDTPFGPLIAKK